MVVLNKKEKENAPLISRCELPSGKTSFAFSMRFENIYTRLQV